jgi:hypothetical protein
MIYNKNVTTTTTGNTIKKQDNRSLGSNETTRLDNLTNNTNNIGQLKTHNVLPFYVLENRTVYNPTEGNQLRKKELNDTRVIFQKINSLRPHNTEKWKATVDRIYTLEVNRWSMQNIGRLEM